MRSHHGHRRTTRSRRATSIAFLVVALGLSTAIAGAAPGFQIRPTDPETTARTLAELEASTRSVEARKVWVFFTDKAIFDSDVCETRLDEVRAALTPRAAARRAKSVEGLVDFFDIPVVESYVAKLESRGVEIARRSRWMNAVSVRGSLDELREIATLPFVQRLQPVRGGHADRARYRIDDSHGGMNRGGNYGDSFDQYAEIGVVDAHDAGYTGAGVLVCMIDTGFKHTHPAFATTVNDGRVVAQWDFVNDDGETMNEPGDDSSQHNHGTYTWSALGGLFDGELIAPAHGADFLLAKTEDLTSETPVEEDNWVAASEWADAMGADVISSSLTYLDWYTPDDMDGNTAVITIGADIAVGRGIVVVQSAGNQGTQDWQKITPPADGDSVIAVGAIDWFGTVAGFSSLGPTADGRIKPDVVARGEDTYCAIPEELGEDFWWISGTSLSCPLVGGAVALLLEARPELNPREVWTLLTTTADNAAMPDTVRGWGLINVWTAINSTVSTPEIVTAPTTPQLAAVPNPFHATTRLNLALPGSVRGQPMLEIFDPTGRRVRALGAIAGARSVVWDGADDAGRALAPGVYVARLTAGDWRATAKVVLRP